jgi:hypothetical protein
MSKVLAAFTYTLPKKGGIGALLVPLINFTTLWHKQDHHSKITKIYSSFYQNCYRN